MRSELCTALHDVEIDASVRCVVLKGAGDHFMAGGDVKGMGETIKKSADQIKKEFMLRIHDLHPIMFAMRRMPKPIIASCKGAAAGAGVSMALACDLVIAAEDAFFTLAYCKIGTSPDGSSSFHLPRAVGIKRAMEIALLGDRFSAQTAKDIGMINFIVPNDELESETQKLPGWQPAPHTSTATPRPCSIDRWKVNSSHSYKRKPNIFPTVPRALISKKV
jgi:2-(1,2-epoxy-1,2-dihydrophenyl)acetyl-CoA isomerase